MNPGSEFVETVLTIGSVVLCLLVAGGFGLRWYLRRPDREVPVDDAVLELEERIESLEDREGRMAELEERLDFAERVLTTRQGAKSLMPREER